jgi:hypothetical protein
LTPTTSVSVVHDAARTNQPRRRRGGRGRGRARARLFVFQPSLALAFGGAVPARAAPAAFQARVSLVVHGAPAQLAKVLGGFRVPAFGAVDEQSVRLGVAVQVDPFEKAKLETRFSPDRLKRLNQALSSCG